MVIAEHLQFVCNQFSNPRRYVRFARWSGGVVLGNAGVEKTLVAGLSPSLRESSAGTKCPCNKRMFLFLRELRCGPPWIFPSCICNRSGNTAPGNPTL